MTPANADRVAGQAGRRRFVEDRVPPVGRTLAAVVVLDQVYRVDRAERVLPADLEAQEDLGGHERPVSHSIIHLQHCWVAAARRKLMHVRVSQNAKVCFDLLVPVGPNLNF